jgi:hypothetical protein
VPSGGVQRRTYNLRSSYDPVSREYVLLLEKVQRRGARFVLSRFGRFDSVSNMLAVLAWPTLENRRKVHRLLCFYKVFSNMGGWSYLNSSLSPATFIGRGHQYKVFLQSKETTIALNSFLYRGSRDWNALPSSTFESGFPTYSVFHSVLARLFSHHVV